MTNEEEKKTEAQDEDDRIPVTILSGFLGSGKTTLLRYILQSHEHKKKVAVIVNDMAELNIDAAMVGGDNGAIVQAKKEVVQLSNGCICCNLRGDLIREIDRIRKLGTFDYILIESTGVAEPQEVAESFCADPNTEQIAEDPSQMLWTSARLDTCVTVLDAREFPRYVKSVERFKDQFTDGVEENDPAGEGEKSIANLLIEQVEFANVILVNKTDLVTEAELDEVTQLASALNRKAKIIPTEQGVVDLKYILNSHSFSMEEAQTSPGWLHSLKEASEEKPSDGEEEEEHINRYGITSFVYRARRPFHPARLSAWIQTILHFSQDWNEHEIKGDASKLELMEADYGQILRSKGFCWIAGRDGIQAGWAHSGRLVMIQPTMPWCADRPEEDWNMDTPEEKEEMRKNFEGPYGDRRQALVFIGINLKKEALISSLDECLLTDDELKVHSLTAKNCYHDTLPAWTDSYDLPGSAFRPILQHAEPHKFQISEGLLLQISNIALHIPQEVEEEYNTGLISVKVWLDTGEGAGKSSQLLATLRPGSCEQYSLSVNVAPPVHHEEPEEGEDEHNHGDDAVETFWLRMQLVGRSGKRTRSGDGFSMSDLQSAGVKVHVMGSVILDPTHLQMAEANEADEEGPSSCPL